MTYYCIYKDECKNKKCKIRETNDKRDIQNLRTEGFRCSHIKSKFTLLTTAERLVCEKRLKCKSETCVLKVNYLVKKNIVANAAEMICPLTSTLIKLTTDNENTACISIWEH